MLRPTYATYAGKTEAFPCSDIILHPQVGLVNKKMNIRRHLLRVTLYAEKIETVFPALFFYPEDGGRR